jgi:hypothetical protein
LYRTTLNVEIRALLGHYAASSGRFLQTFRDNLSVPSSEAKNPKVPTKFGRYISDFTKSTSSDTGYVNFLSVCFATLFQLQRL